MSKLTRLTYPFIGALAVLGAGVGACSSPAGTPDDDDMVSQFGQPGNGGSSGVVGGAGTTGQINNTAGAGTSSGGTEGVTNPVLTGGAGTTGVGAAGSGSMEVVEDTEPQVIPPSYFQFRSWQGYAFTYSDPATTRSVTDFSALTPNTPFCMSGSVAPDNVPPAYEGVASIGFNINQAPFGDTADAQAPALGIAPEGMGVAVNYTKTAGQILRIQLEAPGATTDDQRWCAELSAPAGPAFVLYSTFRTRCWLAPTDPAFNTSVAYARQPISAVVMTVPGDDLDPVPYNVCVAGFADGNSEADAPTGGSLPTGLLTGTLSGEAARIRVTGKDGNAYVVNNNAWGDNSNDGTQQIPYTGNSFEILRQTAGQGANSSPASFPSIYIGNNGATTGVNGATTLGEDKMPIQVSAITSLPTTFNHSGPLGDNNATYDVWFAPSGTPSAHGTAQAAFLMVWTHRPAGRSPIGSNAGRTNLTINGVTGAWDLWVGPRGGGGPDANLPVLSYVSVNPATVRNFSFDLSAFIRDAVARNVGLTNGMFLTDVFAGFEIWGGGAGLRVDEFSAVINP